MKILFTMLLLLSVSACNPIPSPYPCSVITLDLNKNIKVLKSYGSSFFNTSCPKRIPKEILIMLGDYNLYMYLQSHPRVFVGIESKDSGYEFITDDWDKTSEHSTYKRATHVKNLVKLSRLKSIFSDFSNGIKTNKQNPENKISFKRKIRLRIKDPEGKIINHSFPFEVTKCTCKSYDAV